MSKAKPWPLGPGKPRRLTLADVLKEYRRRGGMLTGKHVDEIVDLYKSREARDGSKLKGEEDQGHAQTKP